MGTTKHDNQTLLAEAHAKSEEAKSTTEKIYAAAEGKIAAWIKNKNDFETEMKKIQVYDKLASNDDVILSDSIDDDTNVIQIADAMLHTDKENSSEDEINLSSVAVKYKMLKVLADSTSVNTPKKV